MPPLFTRFDRPPCAIPTLSRSLALSLLLVAATAHAQDDFDLDALFADEAVPADAADAGDGGDTAAAALPTIPVEPARAPEDSAPAPPAPRRIEEIVVTATKRESSVRDIPISIDAMSGEQLTESGATGLEQILAQSPGVTFSSSGGSEIRQQVVIRGVTASGTASYGGSTTGYLFNDVSLVNPSLAGSVPGIDPYDLATLEVLKGPQGTLFGGAALAGAVRYVPHKPVFGEFSGGIAGGLVTMADSDEIGNELTGRLNLPVGEEAAVRIAASQRQSPGVLDDLSTGEKDIDNRSNLQARVIGSWAITDRLGAELMAYSFDAEADASGASDNRDARTTASRRVATPGESSARIYRGELQYDFDGFHITGIGSYIEKDSDSIYDLTAFHGLDGVPGLTVSQNFLASSEQTTGELRLVSSAPTDSDHWLLRDWQYLAGLYWLDADQVFNLPTFASLSTGSALDRLGLGAILDLLPIELDPSVGLTIGSDVSATADEKAFFFDLTRTLGEAFELNLGGRYFRQSGEGQFAGSLNRITTNSGSADLTEEGFNPKFALTWRATDDIAVIASYAKGFRFGGFNNNPLRDPGIPFTYYSDEIRNYELSLRSDWLGGALRIDSTAFYVDWINPQVRQSSQVTSTSFITNAGAARVQGIESAITALLPAGITLMLNGSYLDARLTEAFDSARGLAEKGSRLPATPFVTAAFNLSHQGAIGRWETTSALGYTYQGEANSEVAGYEKLPAYGLLGASINLRRPGTFTPTLRVSGTNLLNETVPANAFQGISSTGGKTNYGLIQARTLVVSLGVEF